MGDEKGFLAWSIPIIIPHDAIFLNNWWSVTYCQVFSTSLDWFRTGLDRISNDLLFKKLYSAFGYKFLYKLNLT